MDLTVRTKDLLNEMKLVKDVASKTSNFLASHVLLEASEDGVRLTANDLELCVRTCCCAGVRRGGSIALPAETLFDYLKRLPDADLKISKKGNDRVELRCGSSRLAIAGVTDGFPEAPSQPEPVAELPNLAEMVSKVVYAVGAVGDGGFRFTLNAALLAVRGGEAVMAATDGRRLAVVRRAVETDAELSELVPLRAMKQILRIPPGAATVSSTDTNLFFDFGRRLLIARKIEGRFPDFERILPQNGDCSAAVARKDFIEALERAVRINDKKTVRLKLEHGLLAVRAESGGTEIEEEIAASGRPFEILFNASYLLDFLKADDGDQVCLFVKDETSAAELRSSESCRYVVMPVRP